MLLPTLYQSIFSCSPIGAYILSPSADPIILDVNDAFLRTVAHTRAQLVGLPLFTALPEDPSDLADTGVEALRKSLARVIETGQPQSLPTQRYPIRATAPDGREYFVERFWNAINTPIFDDAGELLCILHVTIEVTEQKRAEEAAMEAAREAEAGRARLDAVLQSVSVGIMMADVNGNLLHANPEHARLWGRSQPLTNGRLCFDEWRGWWADGGERHGQRVKPGEWPLSRAFAGEASSHQLIEIETFEAPFQRRIVLSSGSPIRDSGGTVVAGVVALLDLTERLNAEAALREADRRKDEFLAMLAHERPACSATASSTPTGRGRPAPSSRARSGT
jgi:PAS domain S-box-containing protein